jgi:predicted RNA-binding Zn-ribbon protein involved in translation (DUF1610 family)
VPTLNPASDTCQDANSEQSDRYETLDADGVGESARMTIEESDTACPDCGSNLQVIYVTELRQVVSGWACPDCGFLASEKHGFADSVPKPEHREYVIRREKPLTSDDVRDPLGDLEDEFRARASAQMDPDERWLLVDPADGSVVDSVVGDEVESVAEDDRETPARRGDTPPEG